MLPRPPPEGTLGGPAHAEELTPEQQDAYEAGLERAEQEKRQALLDPGPSWREWFFFDAAKWWVGLGFLIVDVWVVASWIAAGTFSIVRAVAALLTLVGAIYLELLLYRYLWRRPSDTGPRRPGPFRPSWRALREVGRWTPEEARRRATGDSGPAADGSLRPDDFL